MWYDTLGRALSQKVHRSGFSPGMGNNWNEHWYDLTIKYT